MRKSAVLGLLDRIGRGARDQRNILLPLIAAIAAGVGFATSSVALSLSALAGGVALWAGLVFFANIATNLERLLEGYEASAKALGFESLDAAKAAGREMDVARHYKASQHVKPQ